MTIVYVGVGTNVDRIKHTHAAINELFLLDNQRKVSPIYECAPVGFDSSSFYNFVVELSTNKKLTDFSHELRKIELKWGRPEDAKKCQDRNLDLDILLFGDEVSPHSPTVPRDDIFKYPFVIQPLFDLVPELVIPSDGRRVKEIWQIMDHLESLTKVDFVY
ncbi:2-amino-4-hydroxy-6-hydroxymethyldihydropteridine diphosphokinase [Vibrio sp. F74]|uniref:2-amino-4-hydroxy-6- hydroxymethyldihydropteridine diphosphokinase n=1 Tax=Vibrio sp. F74 TaxID=700020 RepID=UPI0035F59420